MSASVALLLIGGLLLMVAIIGGGLELKELKIPRVERLPRVGCGIAGIVFVLLGFSSIDPPQGRGSQEARQILVTEKASANRGRFTIINKLSSEGIASGQTEQAQVRIDGNYVGHLTTSNQFPVAELVVEVNEGQHSFVLQAKSLQSIANQMIEINCFGTGLIDVVNGARFSFEGKFNETGGPCLLWLEKL